MPILQPALNPHELDLASAYNRWERACDDWREKCRLGKFDSGASAAYELQDHLFSYLGRRMMAESEMLVSRALDSPASRVEDYVLQFETTMTEEVLRDRVAFCELLEERGLTNPLHERMFDELIGIWSSVASRGFAAEIQEAGQLVDKHAAGKRGFTEIFAEQHQRETAIKRAASELCGGSPWLLAKRMDVEYRSGLRRWARGGASAFPSKARPSKTVSRIVNFLTRFAP